MTVLAPDTGHVDAGLFTAIDAATTTPVYRTVPSSAADRWIRFACVSEVDVYTLSGRAWGEFLYDVTGRDKSGSAAAIKTEMGNVATALIDAAPTVSGGRVIYLRREGRRESDPVENGIQYQMVIDTYRLRVVPA